MSEDMKSLQSEWDSLPIEEKKRHEFSFIRFVIAKQNPTEVEYQGFYMGGNGEYYYNDGRPFPHPWSAKGVIALCNPQDSEQKAGKP